MFRKRIHNNMFFLTMVLTEILHPFCSILKHPQLCTQMNCNTTKTFTLTSMLIHPTYVTYVIAYNSTNKFSQNKSMKEDFNQLLTFLS